MSGEAKLIENQYNNPIYDQFALMEQVGVVNSSRMMTILRSLRKHGPIGEGKLAAMCSERMFLPEWPQFINRLLDFGFIKVSPTGHAASKDISLTPLGEEFLANRLDPKPAPVEE